MSFFSKIVKSLNPISQVKAIAHGDPSLLWNPVKQTQAIINDPSSLLTPNALGPAGAAATDLMEAGPQASPLARRGALGQVSNPFADMVSKIPPAFFQNPQAMAALMQMLGPKQQQQQSAAPAQLPYGSAGAPNPFQQFGGQLQQLMSQRLGGSTPGPAPAPATLMGRVGGFGNGGGKMVLSGNSRPFVTRAK